MTEYIDYSQNKLFGFFMSKKNQDEHIIQTANGIQEHMEAATRQRLEETLKKEQVRKKIDNILGKTTKKLKLLKAPSIQKFNEKLEQLKQLSTFVDQSKRITQANFLNNLSLMKQIQQFQLRRKIKRVLGIEQNKMVADVQDDALFQELNYDDEDEPIQNIIQFVPQNKTKRPNISIENYTNAKALIQISNIIQNRKHNWKESQSDSLLQFQPNPAQELIQQSPRFEEQFFFSEIQDNHERYAKRIQHWEMNKQRLKQQNMEQMLKEEDRLINLAKSIGINLNDPKIGQKQDLYEEFKKKSEIIIQKALDQAKQKLIQQTILQKKEEATKKNKFIKKSVEIEERLKRIQKYGNRQIHIPHSVHTSVVPKSPENQFISQSQLQLKRFVSRGKLVPLENSTQQIIHQTQFEVQESKGMNQQFKKFQTELELTEMDGKAQNDLINQHIDDLELHFEELQHKVNFHAQLKSLGFADNENTLRKILMKSDHSNIKKLNRKNQNRAMKIIKHGD